MKTLPEKKATFLLSIASRIVPEIETLDEKGVDEFLEIIDRTLLTRPPYMLRQFSIFLTILRWSSVFRHFKPLDKLNPDDQTRQLHRFQNSSIGLIRLGLWGLKTLVFMGYYGQPEVAGRIHYTPSFDGNRMLNG